MANPTLAQLRTKVARDLRDPNMRTFLSAYVDDLINAGIEEVSRLYPREVVLEVVPVAGDYTYAVNIDTAFRAEMWRSGVLAAVLTENDGTSSQTGWDLFGGELRLPSSVIDNANVSTDRIALWGYANRPQLTADADVSVLDDTAEWGVRRYARAQAFALMQNDRALFKQWQGGSQNTDVSPNQLNQMVSLYASEWDRTRNYLRRLRRQ